MAFDVNLLAVIIAAVLNMAVGAAWYSPSVFGRRWAEAYQINMAEECAKPAPLHFIGAFAVSFITAWVQALLFKTFSVNAFSSGMAVSFFLWLGFVATHQFSGVIWAKRPLIGYIIDVSHVLIGLLLMGLIFTYWK